MKKVMVKTKDRTSFDGYNLEYMHVPDDLNGKEKLKEYADMIHELEIEYKEKRADLHQEMTRKMISFGEYLKTKYGAMIVDDIETWDLYDDWR